MEQYFMLGLNLIFWLVKRTSILLNLFKFQTNGSTSIYHAKLHGGGLGSFRSFLDGMVVKFRWNTNIKSKLNRKKKQNHCDVCNWSESDGNILATLFLLCSKKCFLWRPCGCFGEVIFSDLALVHPAHPAFFRASWPRLSSGAVKVPR